LHHQLLSWRGELVGKRLLPWTKRVAMTFASRLFQRPGLYRFAGKAARTSLRVLPHFVTHNRFNKWTIARELPEPPKESFRDWHKRSRQNGTAANGTAANGKH
jgi:L-lactate dehydrogenase complex protein LldF